MKQEGTPYRLNYKVFLLVFLLFSTFIVMLVNFQYVAITKEMDFEYVRALHKMEDSVQRIGYQAERAANGELEYFNYLRIEEAAFEEELLNAKNVQKNSVFIQPAGRLGEALAQIEQAWGRYKQGIQVILTREHLIASLVDTAEKAKDVSSVLEKELQSVKKELVFQTATVEEVDFFGKEIALLGRILRSIDVVLRSDKNIMDAASDFSMDLKLFSREFLEKLEGSDASNTVTSKWIKEKLVGFREVVQILPQKAEDILKNIAEYYEVRFASAHLFSNSQNLLDSISNFEKIMSIENNERWITRSTGITVGVVYFLEMCFLLVYFYIRFISIRREIYNKGKENQYAIDKLLRELRTFANGDLSVKASTGNEITGAIAEAVNKAADSLRKLVITIRKAAGQVFHAAQSTQVVAQNLVEAADHQAREITGATVAVGMIAASIEHVSGNASASAEVAKKSVVFAKKGVLSIQNNMSGMERIRVKTQETAKKIKHLGESSQEIGDTVLLINDIAEQTNILALNAAIQAAMAGEVGRGFAVVAEEVQILAERSSTATKQIENLVRGIQKETNETVRSMEQTMAEAIQGAVLSQEAGASLEEIETVSGDLSALIQKIFQSSQEQSLNSARISKTMNVIQEITAKTATETTTAANSIGLLTALSVELKNSISGFKLPDDEK